MDFQIRALDEQPFCRLFGQESEVLARQGIERKTVDGRPGYPCRISLRDVDVGETVLLVNYEHLPGTSPYRSSHAIFVREGATKATVDRNEIPEMLRIRLLSVRAFDEKGMMIDADVVDGHQLEPVICRMLSNRSVDFLHLHNAKHGCFMARVDKA